MTPTETRFKEFQTTKEIDGENVGLTIQYTDFNSINIRHVSDEFGDRVDVGHKHQLELIAEIREERAYQKMKQAQYPGGEKA